MALLALEDLHLSFGGVAALAGVSLEVDAGDFFAVSTSKVEHLGHARRP